MQVRDYRLNGMQPYIPKQKEKAAAKSVLEENSGGGKKESWAEIIYRLDQETERIRRENKRRQKFLQEERARKRRLYKKIEERLALKKYLARQHELKQESEKAVIERLYGKGTYIKKAPLDQTLGAGESAQLSAGL